MKGIRDVELNQKSARISPLEAWLRDDRNVTALGYAWGFETPK